MRRLLPLIVLASILVAAAPAAAKPGQCTKKRIAEILAAHGKNLRSHDIGDIECGDVTHDGVKDAVFTVLSGGTAGAIRFGVIHGSSATAGDADLLFYRTAYKVGIDRVNSRRFDVQQPFYKKTDPNCCPSAFDVTPYRWDGGTFKAGKSKRHKKPQKRFVA